MGFCRSCLLLLVLPMLSVSAGRAADVDEKASAPPSAASTDSTDETTMPRRISRNRLEYPPEALDQGIEGRVVVSVLVAADGTVKEAKIVRSAHPLLVDAAMAYVKVMRFAPAVRNGTAVEVWHPIDVPFSLPTTRKRLGD